MYFLREGTGLLNQQEYLNTNYDPLLQAVCGLEGELPQGGSL